MTYKELLDSVSFEEQAEKLKIQKYIQQIEQAGGHVPSMEELTDISDEEEYWKRIGVIGEFITKALPQESDVVGLSIVELCELFRAKHCKWYTLKSYCQDASKRTAYLKELIEKYNADCHNCSCFHQKALLFQRLTRLYHEPPRGTIPGRFDL